MGTMQALENYIANVTAIVDKNLGIPETVDAILPHHTALVENPTWLAAQFLSPVDGRPYSQYRLHVDPTERFSVVAFVWPSGSSTPIHDHCSRWGIVGVYQGVEKGTGYEIIKGSRDEGVVELRETGSGELHQGQVITVFEPMDIHKVENPGETVAISIHCYGTNIGPQKRYSFDLETGAVNEFISGYEEPA